MTFVRLLVLTVGLALVGASVASAFTVPPIAIVDGTEGEVRLLWTEPVAAADVGKECEVVLTRMNNESTREGTDLILESGTTSMVASNVERDTAPQTFVGRLTLGTTITVSVRLGPEGVFSGGSDVVEASCPVTEEATTTRTAPPPVPASPVFTG